MLAAALAAMRCLSPGGLAHFSTRLLYAEQHMRARPTLTTCCSLGAAPRHRRAATAAKERMRELLFLQELLSPARGMHAWTPRSHLCCRTCIISAIHARVCLWPVYGSQEPVMSHADGSRCRPPRGCARALRDTPRQHSTTRSWQRPARGRERRLGLAARIERRLRKRSKRVGAIGVNRAHVRCE